MYEFKSKYFDQIEALVPKLKLCRSPKDVYAVIDMGVRDGSYFKAIFIKWRELVAERDYTVDPLITPQTFKEMKVKDKKEPETFVNAFKMIDVWFKLNEIGNIVEVKQGSTPYSMLDDIAYKGIVAQLCGLGFSQALIDPNIIYDASHYKYNYIQDYFQGIKYDGGSHIDKLAEYFTDEHGVFPLLLKRWLIGAVARVFEPEGTQNFVLCLDGAQRLGKSFFAAWLSSPLPRRYYLERPIVPNNKDHRIDCTRKFLWEVAELDATFRKKDIAALKAFITAQSIDERAPYGRHNTQSKAIVSFIATINMAEGFLNDTTGNRRFNPATLTKINFNYNKEVNINQVWAEAYHLYKVGEPWMLTQEEENMMIDNRKDYETPSDTVDLLQQYLNIPSTNPDDFMFARDITDIIINATGGNFDSRDKIARAVAKALKQLGIEKRRKIDHKGNRTAAYMGISAVPVGSRYLAGRPL